MTKSEAQERALRFYFRRTANLTRTADEPAGDPEVRRLPKGHVVFLTNARGQLMNVFVPKTKGGRCFELDEAAEA